MKKVIIILFIGFIISFLTVPCLQPVYFEPLGTGGIQEGKTGILDEELHIQKAVEDLYIKGLQIRDFNLIQSICIPEALLMSADRNGKFHSTSLERWSKRFDPKNPPFKQLEYCIVKIDREGTAAQVKIVFIVDNSRQVTDYLHMLKLEGKWRIVNIIDY
jgi:hypothetical protein